MSWSVVKVGGSLYDWPELPVRLRDFLDRIEHSVLIVPGGGATADAIRALDRVHDLTDEVSHWLAIQALSVNAHFLKAFLHDAQLLQSSQASLSGQPNRLWILDCYPFFQEDDLRSDHLPHRWDVTSDSLAVRAARLLGAKELILLKSTEWRGDDWQAASDAGIVDRYFTAALHQTPHELHVRVVNLRAAAV